MAVYPAGGGRRWVPGWAPAFPAGEPPEGEPEHEGTVFVTHAGGRPTIWVVALREPGRGAGDLGAFAAGFAETIGGWGDLITAALR